MTVRAFLNGRVITVDAGFAVAGAVLTDGDRIAAVGATETVRDLAPAGADIVDLGGRALLPGFIDTHGHVALFGLDELKLSPDGPWTKQGILSAIEGRARRAAPGDWIVVNPVGTPPYFLDAEDLRRAGEVPLREHLDRAAPHNPVYIQAPTNRVPNFCVLNSAALRAAGIDGATNVSPHAVVECDRAGRPTGLLSGAVQPLYNADPLYRMVERAAPRPGYADIRDGIAALAAKFVRGGTTTLLEAHLTDPEELRAYAELQAGGRLPLRVFYTFEIDGRKSLAEIETFLKTVRFAADDGFGTKRVMVVGVSIGLDGPYWHGAAHHDRPYPGPFGDTVNPGPLVPWDQYLAIMRLAASMGFRIHAEAAGRGSIGLALRAFAEIDRTHPVRPKRHVIEHVEFPTRDQIAACARLGLAPTTSTNFIWGKGEEVYRARLGDETADGAIPLRDWLDAGVPVAQSTDWGPHEAMFTLWQSLARKAGLTGRVIGPGQRITRAEAIRVFTWNGAYALDREGELGSIEPGKKADLVVLGGDPLTCPEGDIPKLPVDLALVDGEIVHRR